LTRVPHVPHVPRGRPADEPAAMHPPGIVERRKPIGLKGGGDTDQSMHRQQLQQRKAQIDQKLTELSGVRTSLQGAIAHETRQRDDAQRAVMTREAGKRLADQLLDELKRKQQQGEPDLQSTIERQTGEVRGWETELQRAQQELERCRQSLARQEDTLRILESDRQRAERELDDAQRELQRL
jgi:chromosome segregation ATPase